jgi:hypothetical protein
MYTRLKVRASRAKSSSVNCSGRLGRHTAIKKSERKGCRSPCGTVPGGASILRLTDDRARHGGDDSYGKDADGKTGGPRYLLSKRAAVFCSSFGRRPA